MTVSLNLTTEQERELAAVAARLNIPVSELATAAIRDLLTQPTPDFDVAARRILEKNKDLYQRLA